MSTDSRRTSISEDWEQLDAISGADGIYDDTASIRSMTTTLDGDNDSDSSDRAVSEHDGTEAQESDNPGGASSQQNATETHDATEGQDSITLPFHDIASASTSDLQDNDTDSIASADTITEDLLDIVVEPPILLSTLETLLSTLAEIIPLCEGHSTNEHLPFPEVLEALHRLLGTIMDLEEVVSCYTRLWNPSDTSSRPPPLDPMLYKWSSNCALELYQLQAELEKKWTESEGHSASLSKLCEDLHVFIPIMRVYVLHFNSATISIQKLTLSQGSRRVASSSIELSEIYHNTRASISAEFSSPSLSQQ
jgi:hypothetical protein